MFCETTHIAPNSHRKASQDRVDFSNKISTAGKFSSACIVSLVHIIAGFPNRKAFSNVQNDFYSIWEQKELRCRRHGTHEALEWKLFRKHSPKNTYNKWFNWILQLRNFLSHSNNSASPSPRRRRLGSEIELFYTRHRIPLFRREGGGGTPGERQWTHIFDFNVVVAFPLSTFPLLQLEWFHRFAIQICGWNEADDGN